MISEENKNLEDDLPLNTKTELAEDEDVGVECVNNVQEPDSPEDSNTQWPHNYPCRKCDGVVFTSKSLLSWHHVKVHRRHKCVKCSKVFTGQNNFAQHLQQEHPGLPIYKVQIQVFFFITPNIFTLMFQSLSETFIVLLSVFGTVSNSCLCGFLGPSG